MSGVLDDDLGDQGSWQRRGWVVRVEVGKQEVGGERVDHGAVCFQEVREEMGKHWRVRSRGIV